jgi:hypothetical protein
MNPESPFSARIHWNYPESPFETGISILPSQLRANALLFASARDLCCIGSKAKDPAVRDTAFAGIKKL